MKWGAMIPMLVVVALALIGPSLDELDPCASSDGPQFACWLHEHPGGQP